MHPHILLLVPRTPSYTVIGATYTIIYCYWCHVHHHILLLVPRTPSYTVFGAIFYLFRCNVCLNVL